MTIKAAGQRVRPRSKEFEHMEWLLRPSADFPALAAGWDRLNAACADSPVLHSDFIEPLLTRFGSGGERIAVLGDPSAPVAMGIFRKSRMGCWETFQPSQAPLGAWLNCSETPIGDLLRALRTALPGLTLQISITQQDPDIHPRPDDTRTCMTLDYIPTARITISSSFDEYWSARGKNLRRNLRKQRNQLERDAVETRLATVTAPEEMCAAVAAYGALESAGWKSEGGTAIAVDNAQGRFYTDMLERFARRGDARVFQYFFADDLVACDLTINRAGTIVILKTTYDETRSWASPALLMRQDAFVGLFAEAGIRRIEFYGRVMEWHRRWSDEIRCLYHVNARTLPRLSVTHT